MKKWLLAVVALAPTMTLAVGEINDVVDTLIEIADNLYALVFVLIILAFAWGVLKFVFQNGDDQASGKSIMLWSIIALFVLVSVWGIIQILQKTLGIENENSINAPTIPTVSAPIR